MPEVSTRSPASEIASPRRFTLRQRIILNMVIWAGYWVIRLIGPTLRFSVSREEGAPQTVEQRPLIASLWHACIIPSTYFCRNLGMRVMSSNSYDGEYMGRIIRKFGFVPVKGSSSRNAVRALLGLHRALDDGWTVATEDGSAAAHWEHSVAVHADGIWVLTAADGGASGLAPFGITPVPVP